MVADDPRLPIPPRLGKSAQTNAPTASLYQQNNPECINLNSQILERLSAAYKAVLELSAQELRVESIDLSPTKPKLIVTRSRTEEGRMAGDLIGAKHCRGCEVLLVVRSN